MCSSQILLFLYIVHSSCMKLKIRNSFKTPSIFPNIAFMNKNTTHSNNLKDAMKNFLIQNESDAHIVFHTDQHLSEYPIHNCVHPLSNFSGSNAILLMILKNNELFLYCYTDGRYFLQAEKELYEFQLKKMRIDDSLSVFLDKELNYDETRSKKITLDMKMTPNSSFANLQKNLKSPILFSHIASENLFEFIPDCLLYSKKHSGKIQSSEYDMIDLEKYKIADILWIDKNQHIFQFCNDVLKKMMPEKVIFKNITNYSQKEKFILQIDQLYGKIENINFENLKSLPITFLTFQEKKNLLQSFLEEDQCFIVTNISDISWLLNYRIKKYETGNFLSWCIIYKENVILFTDLEIKRENLKIKKYNEFWTYFDTFFNNRNASNNKMNQFQINKIYISNSHNAYINNSLKGKLQITSLICDLKSVKNNCEIIGMLQANLLDSISLIKLFYFLFHNKFNQLSELDVSDMLFEYKKQVTLEIMKSNDFIIQPSFSSIIGSGDASAIIHYRPENKKVQKGVLLMDQGTQYVFGTTDITRTIHLGDIQNDDKFKKYFTLVLKGQLFSKTLVAQKKIFKTLFENLPRYYLFQNFQDYKHGTSHGVGHCNTVHENLFSDTNFTTRNIFSLEPGIYFDHEFGIRIEDCMISGLKHESENDYLTAYDLTFVPLQRDAILEENLNNEEKKTLNLYNERIRLFAGPYLNNQEREWLFQQTKHFD